MSDNNEYTHTLPAGTRIKDYEIESVLGKGGFGITYLARDVNLNKKVAIKELLPDGIATRGTGMSVIAQTTSQQDDFRWAVNSFLQEAQILAGFDHPNIVHVYRLFEAHQTAYMVMPFIQGLSLKQVVKGQKTLPYDEVNKILSLLMDGLDVVHSANTLHRDIKPDNVIITSKGVPMLIDFGAARQQISGKTQDVTSIITPGYAPVEQYSTDARYQGPWSDIYALAACTYFMITGKQPTPASERSDAVRNQQPDPLPKLADLAPSGFPPAFLTAIDTALQMAESMRPQSITEWRSQLSGAVSSPPPMPPEGKDLEEDNSDQTRRISPKTPVSTPSSPPTKQATAPTQTTPHSEKIQPPKKKKKTTLVASICAIIIGLLAAGGYLGWKAFSGDEPGSENDVASKLDKIEAFLEVNKPVKAQSMLTSIEKESVPTEHKDRYKQLSQNVKELMEEGVSTISVSFEPSWAQTYIDGKKCGVTSGKIEVKGLGNHTLRVSADGFQSRSISFEAKEIGSTISLNKITLNPNSKSNTLVEMMDSLEGALDDEDYREVAKYHEQLNKASIPKHLQDRAANLMKKAREFIAKNKWLVYVKVVPNDAKLYLNGTRVFLKNGKFQATRYGKHTLKLTATGYEDKTHDFGLNEHGRPIDIGVITMEKKKDAPTLTLSKEAAVRHAKNFVTQANSKYAIDSQVNYLADNVFWLENQKTQTPKATIKREITTLFTQWPTRSHTIDEASVTVGLMDSKTAWRVSIKYDFEWKDKIFTLKGKREDLFAVMEIKGKTVIVARYSKIIGKDERKFDSKALIAALELFNKQRLSAGDSEGGKTVSGEAAFYSNHTEYYGPRFLNRTQIMQEIRESRSKDSFRLFIAKKFTDFTNMNIEDPTNRTFSFKCETEVHKTSGKSIRKEKIKVRFEKGKPVVISARY